MSNRISINLHRVFSAMPAVLFICYLLFFILFSWLLGNGEKFAPVSGIALDENIGNLVTARLAIVIWGVSLVIFAIVGLVLFAYAGRYAAWILLPDRYSLVRKSVLVTAAGLVLAMVLYVVLADVPISGGLQNYLYKLIASSIDTTVAHVEELMTFIIVLTLVPSVTVSLALVSICLESRIPSPGQIKRYRSLMALTATFLCVGIVQIFFQYQWLMALVADRAIAREVVSTMTLASAAVYTGLFLTQFLSAAAYIYSSVLKTESDIEAIDVDISFLSTMFGASSLEKLRTMTLLLSPLITGLLAEIPGILSGVS